MKQADMSDPKQFKKVGGLFIPAKDPANWLLRNGLVNGYPAYQYDRIEAAVGFCKQRRVCIDGGAHIGSWSVHLAPLFSKVCAFEPIVENAYCFAANLADRPNVILYRAALSDKSGQLYMANKGGKSVSWAQSADDSGIKVSCVALDRLKLHDVDLIKLDVEGAEYEALMGAKNTIERCKPVIVIEEKHDLTFKASEMLLSLGMTMVAQMKHDRIFTWEGVSYEQDLYHR